MFEWLKSFLYNFRIMNKNASVIFLGLDNAGKTTLTQFMKFGRISVSNPTGQPCSEELKIGNLILRTIDVGGHVQARRLWKSYLLSVQGIVFIVDASDSERLDEARTELDGLLIDNDINNLPIVILGNKIDKPGACSEDELRNMLGLSYDSDLGVGKVKVFMCSVLEGQGFREAFEWLDKYL